MSWLASIRRKDIGRLAFSLFLLLWFSATTVGMLAVDLKHEHPECKCGCQTGQRCKLKQNGCCSQQGSCCSGESCCCSREESRSASYRADCQCGRNSLEQIVLNKPYDGTLHKPKLLESPGLGVACNMQALSPQHQDVPSPPPPQLNSLALICRK